MTDPFPTMVREGHAWQCWAVERFIREGYPCSTDALQIRPSMSEIDAYGDAGEDLRIQAPSGRWVKAAMKARNTRFSSPGDYPHPRIIVDSCRAIERACGLAAILVVSTLTRAWLVIPCSLQTQWEVAEFPTPDGPKRCFYTTSANCRTFDQFLSWLSTT